MIKNPFNLQKKLIKERLSKPVVLNPTAILNRNTYARYIKSANPEEINRIYAQAREALPLARPTRPTRPTLSRNNQQRLYNLKELNNLNVNNINTLHNLYKTNENVKKTVNNFIEVYQKVPYSKESWNKVGANFHQLKNYIKSTRPSKPSLSRNNQQRLYNLKELNNLNVNNINTLHNLYKTNENVKKTVNNFVQVYQKVPYSKKKWNEVSANFHQLKKYIKSTRRNETREAARAGASNCLTEPQALAMSGLVGNVLDKNVCTSATVPPANISCLFLGHGNTITDQYIVLPENIGVTFYTEKGKPLITSGSSGHPLLKNFNSSTSIHPNQQHYIKPNSLMYNMTIKFLAFFQNKGNGTSGNFSNYELISSFGYSGIVTKRRNDFRSIFNLTNDDLIRNNINGVHIYDEEFKLRNIAPNYFKGIDRQLASLQSSLSRYQNENESNENEAKTNANEDKINVHQTEILINKLRQQLIDSYKIISFGDNIFGLIGQNDSLIEIINTMTLKITYGSVASIYLKDELINFINSRNNIQPTPTQTYPNTITMEAFKRMKCLALIHHNQNIIPLDGNNTNERHFVHYLGSVLPAIERYNEGTTQKIRLCHGVVCRSYNTNISTNLMPNLNSAGAGASSSSSSASSASSVNLSSPLQLIRTKSATKLYRRTFNDIWTRAAAAVDSILNNSTIQSNLNNDLEPYYTRLIERYNSNKFLDNYDYLFIMYLINDDNHITKVKKLINHIRRDKR